MHNLVHHINAYLCYIYVRRAAPGQPTRLTISVMLLMLCQRLQVYLAAMRWVLFHPSYVFSAGELSEPYDAYHVVKSLVSPTCPTSLPTALFIILSASRRHIFTMRKWIYNWPSFTFCTNAPPASANYKTEARTGALAVTGSCSPEIPGSAGYCFWVIPYEINQWNSRPSPILIKFGTHIETNVNLRCAKLQTCKLISVLSYCN